MASEKEVGKWLRQTRELRGLSQKALAERSGLDQGHLSRIESGLDPRVSTVEQLSNAMGGELMFVPGELIPTMRALMKELLEPEPGRQLSVVEAMFEPEEEELDDEYEPGLQP